MFLTLSDELAHKAEFLLSEGDSFSSLLTGDGVLVANVLPAQKRMTLAQRQRQVWNQMLTKYLLTVRG